MRKHLRSMAIAGATVIILLLSTKTSVAQDFKNAVDYMNHINKEFSSITADTWDYTSAVAHGKSARKIEKRRKEVISTVNNAISKISKLKPFEDDATLRDSTLSYLNINLAVLRDDYSKIVDMEEVAEQSYDLMEAYLLAREKANEKLDEAGNRLEAIQHLFADKHKITITEANDKTTLKLRAANKVYKYYNEIFLIYFKSYKQEVYVLDAMQKEDINGLEQNRSALATISQECITKLTAIKAYSGDASVKTACQQYLAFLKDESDKKLKMVSDYYIKKDNFEKIKASFEAKSEKDRSKKDVDEYNKAINEFNKAVAEFNKVNTELNLKRTKLIENWNNAVASFTDRHVPKNK